MAIKVLELHHHGIRVGATQEDADKTMTFYKDVLGLSPDPGRPDIPTIPGYWMDVGGRAQIHLMGVNGQSKFAQGPGKDPSLPHVALAVDDIQATRRELDRLGVAYWVGVLAVAALLVYEHSLVSPQDLSRLDVAFFNVNGYIAVILLVAVLAGRVV